MPLPKDKDWLNGYKNKAPICAIYKRPTSKHTQTESEELGKKKKITQTEIKRKQQSQYSYQIK